MELGLYIHLPYCPSRCPYCDFNARPYNHDQSRRLLEALLAQVETLAPPADGRRLATVYFGGGSPAMRPARDLARLLEAINRRLGLAADAEVSLEADPGGLSPKKLQALRDAGFNRLSLGAQSFSPQMLRILGRRHGPEHIARAVGWARRAGFDNLNLDLIYALPGQDRRMARADVKAALTLAPEHVSLYELTLSPDTPFGRAYVKGEPPLPDEDQTADMEEAALELLEAAGLARYEVSNFARPGRECRHNQSTWRGGDYLALGPGAHGHLAGRRWAWRDDPEAYIRELARDGRPLAFSEDLPPRVQAAERVMLGLRTREGVDLAGLARLLGDDPRRFWSQPLAQLRERGWARLGKTHLVPTALGLRMADAAAELFL